MLSEKTIPPRERLIFALDVSSVDEAKRLIGLLGDSVRFYKLGLELFMSGGYFELLELLHERGCKTFVDLKLFDVPETVQRAVAALVPHHPTFVSVHGNDRILQAACKEKEGLKILAVTVLTSLDRNDLRELGFECEPRDLVLSRAKRALAIGCDGVISSGLEASALRESLGEKFLVVTPGIRPVDNRTEDDQKRVASPEQALTNGADYIVVGRPIRDAKDPRAAAMAIQETIAGLFRS